jgi:hypothetical protein
MSDHGTCVFQQRRPRAANRAASAAAGAAPSQDAAAS